MQIHRLLDLRKVIFMKSKKYALVEKDICVSCGACVKECPMDAIKVWKGCYSVVDPDKCVGCGKCTKICPAGCINLYDSIEKRGDNEKE